MRRLGFIGLAAAILAAGPVLAQGHGGGGGHGGGNGGGNGHGGGMESAVRGGGNGGGKGQGDNDLIESLAEGLRDAPIRSQADEMIGGCPIVDREIPADIKIVGAIVRHHDRADKRVEARSLRECPRRRGGRRP